MAYRDAVSNIIAAESLRPAVHSSNTDGEEVDMQGADSVAVVVSVGAVTGTGGDAEIILEESDESGTGYTAVADSDIIGEEPTGLASNTAYQFGYIGDARYLRATIDIGTETSVGASAMLVKCHLHRRPDDLSIET